MSHATAACPASIVEVERAAIIKALKYYGGNKDGAAYALGIGRTTLYRKIASFEIRPEEWCTWAEGAWE